MNLVKSAQEKLDKATAQVNKILSEQGTLEDFETSESEENE